MLSMLQSNIVVKMCNNSYRQISNFSSADRFIPQRRGSNLEVSHFLLKNNPSQLCCTKSAESGRRYINHGISTIKNKVYRERLWAIVNPNPRKILNFSDAPISKKKIPTKTVTYPLWPVKARKEPLIKYPSLVLTNFDLDAEICYHTIHWSNDGHILSVDEGELYVCFPNVEKSYLLSDSGGTVEHCVCWNHSSTHFAFALNNSRIGVSEFGVDQFANVTVCLCDRSICTITSLVWTAASHIITGCSFGRLSVWSSNLRLLKTVPSAHCGKFITITLSCGEQYIATSATDNIVRVWSWPSLEHLFNISYTSPVRGIAWHPFKESLLAIGGNIGDGSLTLWNCKNHKKIGCKLPPNQSCYIDSLTFSPLTGELVVSYWQQDENCVGNGGSSFIEILANLDKTVDAIACHDGRVLYLMWGADGTQLGTAGADGNFCFWNFMGNSPSIIKSPKRHNQMKKINTILFDSLSSSRYCIR